MEYDNIKSTKNNMIIKINNDKYNNVSNNYVSNNNVSNNKNILLSEITEINQIHDYMNNNIISLSDNINLSKKIIDKNQSHNLNKISSPINKENINQIISDSDKNEIIMGKEQINFEKKNVFNKNDILSPIITLNESNNNEIFLLYKDLVKEFNDFNDLTIKGLLKLKLSIKKFEKVINKSSLKKKTNLKKNDWGFTEQRDIPKSIELFFNIKSDSKLSRTDIGRLFQEYIEKNNLKGNINSKNKLDKRIYRVDDKLSKLFNLSNDEKNIINSCNSSKIKYPNGFNFYNYQTWIKKIYIEEFGNEKKNVI